MTDERSHCRDRDRDESRRHRHRHARRHRHGEGRGEGDRKERVLHTRISEQLSDDIRRLAEDLRVPTSNLVRNVLEEVFTMVESVSEDVGELFDDVLDEAEGARDRIRRRSARSRGRARRHHGSSRRHGAEFDDRVENELRSDEAHERGSSGADTSPDGEAGHAGTEPEVEHRSRPQREFPDVIGWQPLVLNKAQACANCNVDLPRGTRAFVGLGASGLTPTTLCRACTGVR